MKKEQRPEWRVGDTAVARPEYEQGGNRYEVLGGAIRCGELWWVPIQGKDGDPIFAKDESVMREPRPIPAGRPVLYAFTLSMPNRGSANGRWSGEGRPYVVIRRTPKSLEEKSYFYSFGDGWVASVHVNRVTGRDALALRNKSAGFCGYDWMVDEILAHGRIITLTERSSGKVSA